MSYWITLDFDDVVYPWSDTAHAICERAGITNGNTVTQWEMHRDYGCTEEELWEVLGSATISGELYEAAPYPGVLAEIQRLRDYGNVVNIVTARGFGQHGALIRSLTEEYVRAWGVPHNNLFFAKDKTGIPADFALDDGLHNYEALTDAGVLTFLMDRPHNRHAKGVNRVSSVRQFVDLVTSVAWVA